MRCASKLPERGRREVSTAGRKSSLGRDHPVFGRDYLIPKPFDRRLLPAVAGAVAETAMRTGMARRDIDLETYRAALARLRS